MHPVFDQTDKKERVLLKLVSPCMFNPTSKEKELLLGLNWFACLTDPQ